MPDPELMILWTHHTWVFGTWEMHTYYTLRIDTSVAEMDLEMVDCIACS
jgi:hypothetical protein